MYRGILAVAASVLFVALSPPSGAAEISEATRCEIMKLKAIVKEVKDKAQCHERSLKTNVPVPQACLSRAEQKKDRIFERVEERGACLSSTDSMVISSRIDAFLQEITQSLGGSRTPASAKPPAEEKSAEGTEQAKAAEAKKDEAEATDEKKEKGE